MHKTKDHLHITLKDKVRPKVNGESSLFTRQVVRMTAGRDAGLCIRVV